MEDGPERVAIANRILFAEGAVGPSGHVSAVDSARRVVYINPLEVSRGEIAPEHVVEIDLQNEPVDPNARRPVGEAEIHTAIYREREEIGAVLHLHPRFSTLFGISGTDLLPVHVRGSVLDGPVPVLDRPDHVAQRADSDPLLAAMGEQKQVLIRGHGSVVCDVDVERALVRAMDVERNARLQYMASVPGTPSPTPSEEAARVRDRIWTERSIAERWRYHARRAERAGVLPLNGD